MNSLIKAYMKRNAKQGGKKRWRKIGKRKRKAIMKALIEKRWEKTKNEKTQNNTQPAAEASSRRIEEMAQGVSAPKATQEARPNPKK